MAKYFIDFSQKKFILMRKSDNFAFETDVKSARPKWQFILTIL